MPFSLCGLRRGLRRADRYTNISFRCFSNILRYDRRGTEVWTVVYHCDGVVFPVQGFLNSLYFTLRSGGKTIVTFLFDSVYTWAIPVPLALCLCFYTQLPILSVFVIVQAADIIKLVVGYVLIQRGMWISNIVE